MAEAISEGLLQWLCGQGHSWFCGQGCASWEPSLLISERPVEITKPLEDQRTMLGEHVTLSCELSRAGASVRWLKDGKAIRKSQKYDLLSEGTRAVLVVRKASLKDSGEYTCETEASKSTAKILVEGKHMTLSVSPAAWPGATSRTSVEVPTQVSLCAQVAGTEPGW